MIEKKVMTFQKNLLAFFNQSLLNIKFRKKRNILSVASIAKIVLKQKCIQTVRNFINE